MSEYNQASQFLSKPRFNTFLKENIIYSTNLIIGWTDIEMEMSGLKLSAREPDDFGDI